MPKDNIFRGFNGPGQKPERNMMMESTILSYTNDDGGVVDVQQSKRDLKGAKDEKAGASTSSRSRAGHASVSKPDAQGQVK